MCAEYTVGPAVDVATALDALGVLRDLIFDHEYGRVFPRGRAPILIANEQNKIQAIEGEFSLIPEWWDPQKAVKKTKSNRPVFATHNARLETIKDKPAFRDSFRNRHCLVPISAFFESSVFGDQFAGHRVRISSSAYMFAAGCFSNWIEKSTGEIIPSFTIITHTPSVQIFKAGHDRMPVFLNFQDGCRWLAMPPADVLKMGPFLLDHNIKKDLNLSIEVDRPLKDGWQKNAPTAEELLALKESI